MSKSRIQQDREKWLQALETTTAKQGTKRLGDAARGFCCLGIGCEVLDIPYDPDEGMSMVFQKRVGLRFANGLPVSHQPSLARLNDHHMMPFAKIAAHLRAHMFEYFKTEDTL